MIPKKQQSFFLAVLFLLAACCCAVSVKAGSEEPPAPDKDPPGMEILRLQHRAAGELLDPVRAVLSPEGRISVDTTGNALIVVDGPEGLRRAKELVSALDQATAQITVWLRQRMAPQAGRSLSTGSGISGREGRTLATGGGTGQQQFMLRVSSGSTGFLRVGRDIPFDRFWIGLCQRHGQGFGWMRDYQRIETGFAVTPRVIGARVELTLTPRIAFAEERAVSFTEAGTRVVVEQGQWQTIGGTGFDPAGVTASILAAGQDPAGLILEVKAEVAD